MILSLLKVFVRGSQELGFFSVRHNANPTQGVEFHNPYVRRLWEPWSHWIGHMDVLNLMELNYINSVVILCPWTKLSLSP
jgi:hypothetical protein